ncbi:hypothetical protein BKA62DRAFT_679901 [Auriculariales sp. MPI-PUGE-AT-0066]|nr:hypothetical protein BKA62DRAFT_679901 [Auriculariales sp. MPI-PUGE-AT-0066]
MDQGAHIIAGPVNPQGWTLIATWDGKLFLPPQPPTTDDMHLREKMTPRIVLLIHSPDVKAKQPEISTSICYAWAATEVGSASDFPAEPPESAAVLPAAAAGKAALKGTHGSIRVTCQRRTKIFKWVTSMSGDLHPNQEVLQGYRLNVRNPHAPSWVQEKTYRMYESPSKRVEWWNH